MRVRYSLALVVAVAALVGSSTPLRASETDDRIGSSFTKSFVYKTYLKDTRQDQLQGWSRHLVGRLYNQTHNRWPRTRQGAARGHERDNRITVVGDQPAESSDTWIC